MVDSVFLLDTSTLLWALADPERLSKRAGAALRAGPLVLSVASYWEVVIKARRGLLNVADPVTWWTRATDLLGARVLSIRPAHISALCALPDLHKDPFDRILVAQASAEALVLITSDSQIRSHPVKTLW